MSELSYDKELYPHVIQGDPVSPLRVMQSAAGYYIGRSYFDLEFGFDGPYSRESMYYANKEDAEADLAAKSFEVRDCVENNWAYDKGDLPDIRGE